MNYRNRKESSTTTIVEAVETLSNIADLNFDSDLGISQRHDLIIQDKKISYRTVHWLHHRDVDSSVEMVKETFRIILNYLRNFYKKEFGYITNQQTLEGIKTIMVLVGEAAKKLDKYTSLFHKTHAKSVTQLKEYKKLQEFYFSKIARRIDEGLLGKWIMALSTKVSDRKVPKLEGKKRSETKHIFIDLDSVKRDTEYELFFMRKEDGTRFFSPRLVRNIKLVSDFGDYFGEYKDDDPIENRDIWHDRCLHACAKNILNAIGKEIDYFYRESMPHKDREYVEALNKTLIALMLCSNPHNLMHHSPIKSCRDYFYDFQFFLRAALQSADYQRLIAYPPKKSNTLATSLLHLTHSLCRAFCCQMNGYQDQKSMIHGLIHEAIQSNPSEVIEDKFSLYSKLSHGYASMTKLLNRHSGGSMNVILEALEGGKYQGFDPLFQGNIPQQLYTIYVKGNQYSVIRLPSPTQQEFIHKASIVNEFKGCLRAFKHDQAIQRILLFNLQDRTSWKDHVRCVALQELQKPDHFPNQITIAEMTKDTEFFHQLAPYHHDNHAETFMRHFREHLADEGCGYVFSEHANKGLSKEFIDETLNGIHQVFFSGKNILLREHRMDFIELFYLFLQLKLIELEKPSVVSFTCKDSIDNGQAAATQLFLFLKLLNQKILSEADYEDVDLMIYGPALMQRDRVMLPERFNRMLSAIKLVESTKDQMGYDNFIKVIHKTFGKLFKTPMLGAKVLTNA